MADVGFVVSGDFKVTYYLKPNPFDSEEGTATATGWFTISVSNCFWNIRYWQSDEANDYTEAGTDGHQVFSIRSFINQNPTNSAGQPSAGVNREIGFVNRRPYPNPIDSLTQVVLWWGYASSCYLETNSESMFFPMRYTEDLLFSQGLYLKGVKLPGMVHRNSRSPRLPATLIIMDDGMAKRWPRMDTQMYPDLMSVKPRRSPYDKGFTNSILSASEFKNLGKVEIPQKIAAQFFEPNPKGVSSSELTLVVEYSIRATNMVETFGSKGFVPVSSHKIFTVDNRFVDDSNAVVDVGYLTEGRWLADDEVRARGEYTNALAKQPADRNSRLIGARLDSQRRSGGRMVFALFGAAIVALVVVLLRFRKSQ